MSDEKKLATVDCLPGRPSWSAKAALGDALQRSQHNSPIIIMWIGDDGMLHYSHANTTGEHLSIFAVNIMELAQQRYRKT